VADFVYDAASGRYRNAGGRYVTQASVRDAVDDMLDAATARMQALARRLQAGTLHLASWQRQMAAEIKAAHLDAAIIAHGGRPAMTKSDYGWAGRRIRDQYGYLRAFARQAASGEQPLTDQLVARAALYGQAGRATYEAMRQRDDRARGFDEERNVLGAADHCPDCVGASARGWVPIGTLIPIGQRVCRVNCRCRMERRASPAGARTGAIQGPGDPIDASAPVGSIRELQQWAEERHPGIKFRLRGASPSAVGPLIEQFDRLAAEYPEVADHIQDVMTGPLPTASKTGQPTTWAEASVPPDSPTPRITLNDRVYDRAARSREHRAERVSVGWYPSGTTAPAATMTHEFAHHIMFWLQERGVDVEAEVKALGPSSSVSIYATRNWQEAFAEAFAAHVHGDDAARNLPYTRGVLDIIEREIARAREKGKQP
jgi:hypothetical protein